MGENTATSRGLSAAEVKASRKTGALNESGVTSRFERYCDGRSPNRATINPNIPGTAYSISISYFKAFAQLEDVSLPRSGAAVAGFSCTLGSNDRDSRALTVLVPNLHRKGNDTRQIEELLKMAILGAHKTTRIQDSLLSRLESRILHWLAGRMPDWVSPDMLTLLGLTAMLLAGLFYFLSRWETSLLHLVNLAVIANWFGDSLDGTLARFRCRQRPKYGYYVDHLTDALGVTLLVSGLGLSAAMSPWVAVLFLVSYLLLSINSYLAASSIGVFRISFWRISPTELRLLLILGNLFVIRKPAVTVFGQSYLLFDLAGVAGAAIILLLLLISAVQTTRELYRLEKV